MAEKAGIKKNVYPHLLRHQLGSDLLRETGNLRLVQKALGYQAIKTTTIYTHVGVSPSKRVKRTLTF